jgi:hypothetical protein
MILMYLDANLSVSVIGRRKWRLRLAVLGLFKCFLPACLRFIFPLAVTRKRFLAPLCVFNFGMTNPDPMRKADHTKSQSQNGHWLPAFSVPVPVLGKALNRHFQGQMKKAPGSHQGSKYLEASIVHSRRCTV